MKNEHANIYVRETFINLNGIVVPSSRNSLTILWYHFDEGTRIV